jgi:cytochrome c2
VTRDLVGRRTTWVRRIVLAVAVVAVGACTGDRGESATGPGFAAGVEVGDVDRGRDHFVQYGCGACHQFHEVPSANGRVGPNLDGIADQRIIGGVLANTPEFLAAWIRDPQAYSEDSGMPNVGVTEEHSLDIAAFLLEHG